MTNPFKKESTIIIATLGPSTFEDNLLKNVEDKGVDFVRINLSHTSTDKIEETVQYITDTIATPLMIDTEGSQVRTGDLGVSSITLTMGNQIRVYKKPIVCDEENIYIRPEMVVDQLQVGNVWRRFPFQRFRRFCIQLSNSPPRSDGKGHLPSGGDTPESC